MPHDVEQFIHALDGMLLEERGHPERAFGAVVLKHPKTFDADVLAAAETRLVDAKIDPQPYIDQGKGTS